MLSLDGAPQRSDCIVGQLDRGITGGVETSTYKVPQKGGVIKGGVINTSRIDVRPVRSSANAAAADKRGHQTSYDSSSMKVKHSRRSADGTACAGGGLLTGGCGALQLSACIEDRLHDLVCCCDAGFGAFHVGMNRS